MPTKKSQPKTEQNLTIPIGFTKTEQAKTLTKIQKAMVDCLIQANSEETFFSRETLDVAINIYSCAELQLNQLFENKFVD